MEYKDKKITLKVLKFNTYISQFILPHIKKSTCIRKLVKTFQLTCITCGGIAECSLSRSHRRRVRHAAVVRKLAVIPSVAMRRDLLNSYEVTFSYGNKTTTGLLWTRR